MRCVSTRTPPLAFTRTCDDGISQDLVVYRRRRRRRFVRCPPDRAILQTLLSHFLLPRSKSDRYFSPSHDETWTILESEMHIYIETDFRIFGNFYFVSSEILRRWFWGMFASDFRKILRIEVNWFANYFWIVTFWSHRGIYSYYKTETYETRDIQLELLKVRLCQ